MGCRILQLGFVDGWFLYVCSLMWNLSRVLSGQTSGTHRSLPDFADFAILRAIWAPSTSWKKFPVVPKSSMAHRGASSPIGCEWQSRAFWRKDAENFMNHHEPTENAWLKKCLDQKIPTQNSVVHPNQLLRRVDQLSRNLSPWLSMVYHHRIPWFPQVLPTCFKHRGFLKWGEPQNLPFY
jgi:hypothetical protein